MKVIKVKWKSNSAVAVWPVAGHMTPSCGDAGECGFLGVFDTDIHCFQMCGEEVFSNVREQETFKFQGYHRH